jgi:hypothetical protein
MPLESISPVDEVLLVDSVEASAERGLGSFLGLPLSNLT